jgi:psp operon transcriptional activator
MVIALRTQAFDTSFAPINFVTLSGLMLTGSKQAMRSNGLEDMGAVQAAALIGQSAEFLALLEHVSLAAGLNRPVLLIGERGTGKELIAARVHFLSKRWDRPFIKLNCAALAESLLESELFGYEPGAFTGANKKHPGRFELAHTGTLFLDELATMSPRVQEKLLRVLEYGEFERLGGRETLRVDVRVVGATNADLPALAAKGEFRADLLDRLAFDVITLPPLRARRADIMPLAEHYAMRMTLELKRELFAGFSASARQAMLNYLWPGNVRELKNVVERAVYRLADANEAIDILSFDPFASPYKTALSPAQLTASAAEQPEVNASLPTTPIAAPLEPATAAEQAMFGNAATALDPGARSETLGLEAEVMALERRRIGDALQSTRFNQRKAAAVLQLSYHQFRGYLRKYKIAPGEAGDL